MTTTELDEHVLRVLLCAHEYPFLEPYGGMPSALVDQADPSKFNPAARERITFWQRELERSRT